MNFSRAWPIVQRAAFEVMRRFPSDRQSLAIENVYSVTHLSRVVFVVQGPRKFLSPTFSTGEASGRKGSWNQGRAVEGLHYMAGCDCGELGAEAGIVGWRQAAR